VYLDDEMTLTRLPIHDLSLVVGLGGSETFSDKDLLSGNVYNVYLTMSWKVDVWGKLRQRVAAGKPL
jgi:hypothetical protein